MVDNTNEIDKGLESALKALEQAKARVANEKKKQNEKHRKAENHHKYIMGGIVAKYFPKCYCFDEQELNSILSAALATRECKQMIEMILSRLVDTFSSRILYPMLFLSGNHSIAAVLSWEEDLH